MVVTTRAKKVIICTKAAGFLSGKKSGVKSDLRKCRGVICYFDTVDLVHGKNYYDFV